MPCRIAILSLLALVSLAGCDEESSSAPTQAETDSTSTATASSEAQAPPPASASATTIAPSPEQLAAWSECAERRQQALGQEALEGAPEFEKNRLQLTARPRGPALLWRRAPQPQSDALKSRLEKNRTAVAAVKGLLRRNKSHAIRRKILLRENYLYADDPAVALALVEMLSLPRLFGEQTIFLERQGEVLELERVEQTRLAKTHYAYAEGIHKGTKAELLLGDRVARDHDKLADAPLYIDLRSAYQRGAWDRLRVTQLNEQQLVAELRYGPDVWVPALFALEGPKATLSCEVLDAALATRKAAFSSSDKLRRLAMAKILTVVNQQVREELPFDADPNQGNGFLRKAWKRAYFNGWRRFHYEGKRWFVYTDAGQPRPPQVCIDFLTDTWERASGTYYAPATGKEMKAHPKRTEGVIDFDKLEVKNRRSVKDFTQFTLQQPELFDVWEVPIKERIRFKERTRFFDYLGSKADMIVAGDMLTIHGYKEGGRPHYHSIIVLETDPVTGVPTLVAGNAVKPRKQTLEGVMQISPKRTLRHRIRVREPWLTAVATQGI